MGALTRSPQQTSYSICSRSDGKPIIYVIANERSSQCGIWLKMANETTTPMAFIRTDTFHSGIHSGPQICRSTGEVYCTLTCGTNTTNGRKEYVVFDPSGFSLWKVYGDFKGKRIFVSDPAGIDVCITQPFTIDADAMQSSYYEVRVAPGVDAGLMLCLLLGIEK